MPKPQAKSEEELREWEILDQVRGDIDLAVKDYRRRMQNVIPELIDDFRAECKAGTIPAIGPAYRDKIRARVAEFGRRAELSE